MKIYKNIALSLALVAALGVGASAAHADTVSISAYGGAPSTQLLTVAPVMTDQGYSNNANGSLGAPGYYLTLSWSSSPEADTCHIMSGTGDIEEDVPSPGSATFSNLNNIQLEDNDTIYFSCGNGSNTVNYSFEAPSNNNGNNNGGGSNNGGSGSSGSSATSPLSGWAWSSTIGWLSFNSTDSSAGGGPYSVGVSTSTVGSDVRGALSGYAWSPNIGWVSFNPSDLSTCPTYTGEPSVLNGCSPTVDLTTGAVTGWIRALAGVGRTDGWDGWIELSGTNHPTVGQGGFANGTPPPASPFSSNGASNNAQTVYSAQGVTFDPVSGLFSGYAWGGPVVGWLDFAPSITAPCTGSGCGVVSICEYGSPDCPNTNQPNTSTLTLNASSGSSSTSNYINTISVSAGSPSTISWSMENVTGCITSDSDSGSDWSNIQQQNPPNPITPSGASSEVSGSAYLTFNDVGNTHTLSVACNSNDPQNAGSQRILNPSVSIQVTGKTNNTVSCSRPANAVQCTPNPPNSFSTPNGYNGSANTLYQNASMCPTNPSSTDYCQYYCPVGYTAKGGSCVKSTIQEI